MILKKDYSGVKRLKPFTFKPLMLDTLLQSNKLSDYAKKWLTSDTQGVSNYAYLNKPMDMLLSKSAKTEKTKKETGKTQYVLFLSPHNKVSKKTLCPWAEENGCFLTCLAWSGQLGMEVADNAKIKRTILMLFRFEQFIQRIADELSFLHQKYKDLLIIRLNGTQDLFKQFQSIYQLFGFITFVEYSKGLAYFEKDKKLGLNNVTRVFSGSNANTIVRRRTIKAIKDGQHVVIALNTKECKKEWEIPDQIRSKFMDADKHDDRSVDTVKPKFLRMKGGKQSDRNDLERSQGQSFFWTEQQALELVSIA